MYINETNSQIGDLIQLSINDKLNDYTITGVIQFRGVNINEGYKAVNLIKEYAKRLCLLFWWLKTPENNERIEQLIRGENY